MSRIQKIIEIFEKQNPHPEIELNYTNPFTLLVSVLLSAQATDKQINKITEQAFKFIQTPQDVVKLGFETLLQLFKSVNHYKNKSKYILSLSEKLIHNFNGHVPETREELITLPGIGQKSANVILNVLHQQPYIPVDTHVFRVTQRIGVCKGKTPEEIETQLENLTPPQYRGRIGFWFVLHGRYICKAKKPSCDICPLKDLCDYYKATYLTN